ncbi:MAG: hypothetical protein IPH58_15620 [Sphingobacteriales bacterium]|jgi:hypothetical protein|nr:hypothetical protein [Sphingobacteriales bacterium]
MQRFNKILFIIFCILLIQNITAFSQEYLTERLSVEAGSEYRNTDFRWSIDGTVDERYINIYSELIFKPVSSVGAYANLQYRVHNLVSAQISYGHLFTFNGKVTDYDYDGNDRTNPITQLNLKSNKGGMNYFKLMALFHAVENAKMNTAIGLGYSINSEKYFLLDDNNKSLRSTYLAKWSGPQLALDSKIPLKHNWFLKGSVTTGFLKYAGEGNWNLIEEFQHPVSFVQTANGLQLDGKIGAGYHFNRKINLGLFGIYSYWKTERGTDKLFLKNGDTPTTGLNSALKKSIGVSVVANYSL